MKIADILTPNRVIIDPRGESKKRVLEIISKAAAKDLADIQAKDILNCLINRERLGSTGIGHGVAIPHCRIPNLKEPVGVLVKLDEPIDYDDPSNHAVDLLFALLVPQDAQETHLKLLADIAHIFHNKKIRAKLRETPDREHLYTTLINPNI